jgi:hypothetical protein
LVVDWLDMGRRDDARRSLVVERSFMGPISAALESLDDTDRHRIRRRGLHRGILCGRQHNG